MIHNFYAGEATHTIGKRKRRFRPQGGIRVVHSDTDGAAEEDVSRLSSGGLSARLFVGLNVGQTQRWSVDDVTRIVFETRKAQGETADASILLQQGIYEDRSGAKVVEPSVQVIIIDLSSATKQKFVAEMKALADGLRLALEQEVVILEIQKRGIVTDVFSAAA
jgi:hypothetical protein